MRRAVLFSSLFWIMGIASPRAAEQVITVSVNDKVPAGKKPTLVLQVNQDLESLVVDLLRDDGEKFLREEQNVPRKSRRTYELPDTSGVYHYHGTIHVTLPSGEGGSMALDFGTEVVCGLGLSVKQGDLRLDAHTLVLQATRPLLRVDYTVTGEDGSRLGQGSVSLPRGKPPYTIDWTQKDGKVLKIELVAHDLNQIFEKLELIPWRWSIPHEEVEFETGSAEIRPDEAPKLDQSYLLLQEGLAKYGKLLPVKLYIAGYTDTVAAADYNQGLSERRALSIARYFRNKGFMQPIFYQGFGERALRVPTPDETPEAKNRRAEYVLGADPPPMDVPGADVGWKKLEPAAELRRTR